jgi:diketogulonate reductase-like aldo/keto reductase
VPDQADGQPDPLVIGLDPSDTVQKCAEHDIVVEAYSPIAHGLIVNHPEVGDIAARY